ncbi:hypothetical protein ACIBSW_21425 [Actinoplanes sp. NPDC049668]|uniref:hypothetical protein n=1 Tax=unclassified Actinoplanes TaxID=2626549 RepID=UPI0033ACAFC8
MEAALRWLVEHTDASAEPLRLMDATPIPCGQSRTTSQRSDLFGWAGYGYESAHSRWYRGVKLLLITIADGTVTGFGLANPKLFSEREATRQTLTRQPANQPAPGATRGHSQTLPELATPTHRSDHLDVKEPTRPGTTRRAGTGRPMDPCPATPARPQRRDLAQLDHRGTRQTLLDRLRPLMTCPELPVNDLGVVFAVPWLVEPKSLWVELGPWPAVALVWVVGGLIDEAEDDVVEVDPEGSDGDIAVRDRLEAGQPVRQDLLGGLDGCGAVAPEAGEPEVRAGVVPASVEEMEHRVDPLLVPPVVTWTDAFRVGAGDVSEELSTRMPSDAVRTVIGLVLDRDDVWESHSADHSQRRPASAHAAIRVGSALRLVA